MIIRAINTSEVEKWEQYVQEKHTIAWQSYYWSEVVKKHYSAEFIPLAAFENTTICGILPLYSVRSLKGKTQLISVPYAVAGGIVADTPEIEIELVNAAIEVFKEKQADLIIFKQYKHKIAGPLRVDDNFYNRELDLMQGMDGIFDNLDSANKAAITKAKGLALKLDFPSADISLFYKLLLLHHRNSGVPCVSRQWIQDLIDFKMYSIALLNFEGKTVAGTLVKEHKKTVSFPFTSILDDSDTSNMYAYNLYWMLIQRFINEGKEIFHSGRIPNSDITNKYRLGWGGIKHGYFYQYHPESTGTSEYSSKRGRKRDFVSKVWKKLPIRMAAIIGPKIVKYFP